MTDTSLARDFSTATEAEWRSLVDKVLKGASFERRLVTRTADGIAIAPLHVRDDVPAGSPPPGCAPLTRGSRPAGECFGWDIRQTYADENAVRTNTAILEDLAGGVSSVTLAVAAPGLPGLPYEQAALGQALSGVLLDACSVHLRAGEYTPDAAGALIATWRSAGLAEAQWSGGFGYDPLGNLARTGALYLPLGRSLEIAAGLIATTQALPQVTALGADGTVWHSGGATEAQELAGILASLVAYLRAAEVAGISPADALPDIAVTVAIDADQFLGIAKLRALRTLIWRVADACGAPDAATHVPIAAETSSRMLTRRDPWVNMLRTTIACATAGLGGAEAITVLPYTWALGKPDRFAHRIARNTHHVLMEESALGRVADPAGGSWYVERLTADLAAKAWEIFQSIEARGGLGAALEQGWWQDEIARSAQARAKLLATGRLELTGTSAFPRLGDDGVTVERWPAEALSADLGGAKVRPLEMPRDAAPFEMLRDKADAFEARTGKPPVVFLASMGPLAVHATRTTWMRNFLAVGGIHSLGGEGFTNSADAGHAFANSGAKVACLCSSDEVYAELGEATASLLKTAGAERIYLAGRPKEQDRALKAAGVDDFIFAGMDAIATLQRVQEVLDVR